MYSSGWYHTILSWACDAGLLLASVRDPNPVVLLEAEMLYI